MVDSSEMRQRDTQQISTPEISAKRSREHSEGSTKRTKQYNSDDEVLGELDCEGPGSDAEKQIQEQGSVDDGQDVQEDKANYSASTNASVQHLREQIDRFTTQVSTLLEAGKSTFLEMHQKWEEKIVDLHQQQIHAWTEGIDFLHGIDSMNEDINKRLQSAQMVIGYIRPPEL